jgi:hypothetical protein
MKIAVRIIKVFVYLDDLRESGVTNMFGARPYLVRTFKFDEKTAGKYLSAWMATFDGVKDVGKRADEAEAMGLI